MPFVANCHQIVSKWKKADIRGQGEEAVEEFFVDGNVYAFDSSTISLCLNVFWWAKFRTTKAGVKLHSLYNVKTDIPAFNLITEANVADSKVMDKIPYKSGT